jgi:CheY-like chemotaxis protein
MATAPRPNERVNLEHITVLLIDDNPQALEILSSVVQGFGVREQMRSTSALEATHILKRKPVDLIIVDCAMPEMDGYDFVKWLRREMPSPANETPVIMLTGHAISAKVFKSRDCGASFVVTKPLTPSILLDRIRWLSKDMRAFVTCESYVGPDRHVRNLGPPLGTEGRRAGDLSAEVGKATEGNMDQSAIDGLMKPRRVAL